MRFLLGLLVFVFTLTACATGEWELKEARLGGEVMMSVDGKVITIDLDTGVVIGEQGEGPRVRVLRWRVTSGAVVMGAGHEQRVDITSTHAVHDTGWRRCYDVRLLIQSVPLGHKFCTGPEPEVSGMILEKSFTSEDNVTHIAEVVEEEVVEEEEDETIEE